MAEKLGEALLDIDTDDRKFNQGVDRAERKAVRFGKVLDDTSRRAAQVGKALAAGVAVGGAAFAAGIVGAVKRLEEMRKMGAQVDRALKNTSNTARTSAKEIEAWADALENRTGRAAEEVMELSANLASFGLGRDEFFRAIALADDMAAAWGGDLRQNLEGLARALDDPINGMAMLSKRGIKLTEDQKAMAASFLDAGDKARAQGVVFEALEAQVKGVAEAGFDRLSAAIARGQQRWEAAFEDLVAGRGDAGDLRDTLIELADTLSSPEFIRAAMGFGQKLAEGVGLAAQAVIWTWGRVKEFLAWLDGQNPSNMTGDSLAANIAKQQAAIAKAEAQLAGAGDSLFGTLFYDAGGLGGTKLGAAEGIANLRRDLDKMLAEQTRRSDPSQFDVGSTFDQLDGKGTFESPASMWSFLAPGSGHGASWGADTEATAATQKHSEAVRALIADLEHERDIVGLSAQEQQILNTIRDAGVDVMSEEGQKIRELITETEEHRTQVEEMQEVYDLIGDAGRSAILGIVDAMEDGKVEGTELLSILGDVLAMAGSFFLNKGASGFGDVLSGLFSGFFADGGLIPNGSFGIVGENGPEPVWGAPGGTRVMSNPDFMGMLAGAGGRGDTHVTVNGSGLSQGELTRAIADALERFSRFQLPSRVADIQADPHARG